MKKRKKLVKIFYPLMIQHKNEKKLLIYTNHTIQKWPGGLDWYDSALGIRMESFRHYQNGSDRGFNRLMLWLQSEYIPSRSPLLLFPLRFNPLSLHAVTFTRELKLILAVRTTKKDVVVLFLGKLKEAELTTDRTKTLSSYHFLGFLTPKVGFFFLLILEPRDVGVVTVCHGSYY